MPHGKKLTIRIAVSLFVADRRARGYAMGTVRFYSDKLGLLRGKRIRRTTSIATR